MNDVLLPPSEIWSFRRDMDGWRWRRTSIAGEEVAHSRAAFESIDRCVEDATHHSYAASKEEQSSLHGLVGSAAPRAAKPYRTASERDTIERDGATDDGDDDAKQDDPDGETP